MSAAFAAGDTFLDGDDVNSLHLHVVVCGPVATAPSVIVVSFNTVRDWTDKTVVLHPGDHPFITHETSVSFNRVQLLPLAFLANKEAVNQTIHPNFATFLRNTPVTPDLLTRIQQGALVSPLTPKGMKREIRSRLGIT